MPKLTLKKTPELIEQLIDGDAENGYFIISNECVDKTRWSVVYDLIVKIGDKFYQTDYQVGATEQQDEGPWENEEEIVLVEVAPREVKTIQYFPVKD